MAKGNKGETSKKIKLKCIFWDKGEMKKREFSFETKEEALREAEDQFGYIKIYDEDGELCYSVHKETKDKHKNEDKDKKDNPGKHKGHDKNHHGDDDDETYA